MGIVVNKGTQYIRNGNYYQVTRRLDPNRFEVCNVANSLDRYTLTSIDISALVTRGDIEFVTWGLGGKEVPFEDLTGLPETEQKEAHRRYKYVTAVIEHTRYEQSVKSIKEAIAKVAEELSEIVAVDKKGPGRPKKPGNKSRKAPSVESVYRWKKAFIKSGFNIRSLITNRRIKGRKSSIDDKVNELIKDKIDKFYLSPAKKSAKDVRDEILIAVTDLNRSIPESKHEKPFAVPHINTIYRRIHKLDGYEVAEKRYGKAYAKHKYRMIRKGQIVTRIMEVVQCDHTPIDLYIVDTLTRWPIGRPILTVMLDQYSRTVCGLHVGFDPPSYLSDMCCLYNALSSKSYVGEKYPSIRNQWLNHGLCERLLVDNGKDFVSNHFKATAEHLGFSIGYAPPREPWKKGAIERYFRTANTGLLNKIPGTVYSKIIDKIERQKAAFNPKKDAILDLNDFLEALHKWVIDVYHQEYHKGIKDTPQNVWEQGMKEHALIQVPSIEDLRVALGMTFTRKIQRNGIEFQGLFYNHNDMALMREKFKNQLVTLKVDPTDISVIHVHDVALGTYLPVPAVDQQYTRELSLWQHGVVLRRARENYKKVDEYALAIARREIEEIIDRAWTKSKIASRVMAKRYQNERQKHIPSQPAATPVAKSATISDEELISAAAASQPVDYDSVGHKVSNGARKLGDDDERSGIDAYYGEPNQNMYDDEDELETYTTNYDEAE